MVGNTQGREQMAKQVLVIDDDPNTQRFISVLLDENGYETVTAGDGSEGLEKIKQAKPDLIVLDVMMPKKTGFTLFKQLKRDEQYKDIPILMLTGVSGVLDEMDTHQDETFEHPYDSLREALRKGIREMREQGLVRPEMFVDKPVDPDSFIDRVQELIGS
jgi:CheY-like chemotaxis protein